MGQYGERGFGQNLALHTEVPMCMRARLLTGRVGTKKEKRRDKERTGSQFYILAPTPQMLGVKSGLRTILEMGYISV